MFKKLAISKRIAIGIMVPVLGAVVLGGTSSWNAFKDYSNIDHVSSITDSVIDFSALTEDLQVERGQSAIMIGSGATTPQPDLLKARKNTDVELSAIRAISDKLILLNEPSITDNLGIIKPKLEGLNEVRAKINSGQMKLGEAMAYYSKTISHIIDMGYIAAQKASSATLALETASMLALAEAKEFAGQERGLLAGLIAANSVSDAQLVKLEQLIGKQDTLIANFLHNQPEKTQARYKELVAGIDLTEVEAVRKQAINAALNGAEITTKPPEWFKVATDRISSLRAVELEAGKTILNESSKVKQNVFNQLIFMGGLSLITLILAGALGWLIARSIRKDIAQTSSEMESLAHGDTSFEITGLGDNTEIGMMAKAIDVFKQNTLERARLEEEADEERLRAKESRMANEAAKDQHREEVEAVVTSLGNALRRLSDGDLSTGISSEYAEEFRQLKQDYENSVHHLSQALGEIGNTTSEIGNNSSEIRRSADELAHRTEQQAAALEQTSAALEEITGTVRESAERAHEAKEKAGIAKNSTMKSGEVVKDAVEAMGRIEAASGEISQIIGVIDEIAFQTNLLALNAGVEAARAGEAGKGFAVVAQEVRELAQRSADAAKQIKELISNSGGEVANGVSLVQATGEALETISSQVVEIESHIQSIARAASEQSEGLNEVNRAVHSMDQVTQQNAAMVEETNAVTHRLTEETETLSNLVRQFKIRQYLENAA